MIIISWRDVAASLQDSVRSNMICLFYELINNVERRFAHPHNYGMNVDIRVNLTMRLTHLLTTVSGGGDEHFSS